MCPVSDYYQLDDLLTPEEKAVRARVREAAEKHIAPIIAKVIEIPQSFLSLPSLMILIHVPLFCQYWEKAEFPFELVPKLAQLNVSGGTIQVCPFSFCKENRAEKNISDIFISSKR